MLSITKKSEKVINKTVSGKFNGKPFVLVKSVNNISWKDAMGNLSFNEVVKVSSILGY